MMKKSKSSSSSWRMILVFIVFWFVCMICGWFIFYSTIESSDSGGGSVVTDLTTGGTGEEVRGGMIAIIKGEESTASAKQEEPVHHPIHDPVPLIPQEEKKIPLPNLKDLPNAKVEPQQLQQPPPLLKTGAMWKMSVAEQRRYLQSLHDHEVEPSLKSANEFIEYAQQSLTMSPENLPANDPINAIWPHPSTTYDPQVGFGSPGQSRISYHIAGKDVKLPYGYPEESIFILTASYRDPEVASTIARAYARAAHPDRIFVGIHAQNEGGDLEPERDPIGGLKYTGLSCPNHPVCSRLDNIRVSRAHFSKSEGPTVARAIAERHYQNETYVLGIDSHCHFLRGWDNVGIDMFKRLNNDMALITAYPASYSESLQGGYGGEAYDVNPLPAIQQTICRTRRVNVHTTVSFKHDMNTMSRPPDHNAAVRVAFFAAGFSFSRGHRIVNVPYDYYTPYIFDGEETSMGVRAWTWGYDLYQPDRDIISHFYIQAQSKFRPVFWNSPEWNIQWPTQFGSLVRIQKQLHIFDELLGSNRDPGSNLYSANESLLLLNEIGVGERYGVGPYRDVKEYWKWAKIDLQNNWGVNCDNPMNRNEKGRQFCYSANLCVLYYGKTGGAGGGVRGAAGKGGGMPYVPLKRAP